MVPPVRESLDRLSSVASELNHASDAFNGIIAAVEKELSQIGVGLSAWDSTLLLERNLGRDEDSGLTRRAGWCIGYGRLDDGWRLLAKQAVEFWDEGGDFDHDEDDGDPILLLKAPRAVRLAAAERLEHLIDELTDQAKRYVKSVEKAQALVSSSSSEKPAPPTRTLEVARQTVEHFQEEQRRQADADFKGAVGFMANIQRQEDKKKARMAKLLEPGSKPTSR